MSIRTTVSFDPATVARLERLAKRWGVSKSETLRRALQKAEEAAVAPSNGEPDFDQMSPLDAFDWLHGNPQFEAGWGSDPVRQLREARQRDVAIEEQRERARSVPMMAEEENK